MDQDRQIRFLIPPFFLLVSILWGAYLSGRDLTPIFKPDYSREVLGVLAAAAVAVVRRFPDKRHFSNNLARPRLHCTATHLRSVPEWRDVRPYLAATSNHSDNKQKVGLVRQCYFRSRALGSSHPHVASAALELVQRRSSLIHSPVVGSCCSSDSCDPPDMEMVGIHPCTRGDSRRYGVTGLV